MLRNLGTLVLMLLLATPLAAVAQNTGKLSGRVVDDLGDPLPGANVVVEGTQLGAATDIDGNYFIIGIPVGDYDVIASFVGYQTQNVEGVQISSGYTTEQNFELGPQELGEVTVTYERPIIQKDAIGVPKVVSGEDIENLPIRGVADVAAIQSGVVNNGSNDQLFIRGGRNEEVAYYVDGVKIASNALVGVNQQAIQEQEILIGTIPARYGDVQSGVISITTKSGGNDFFGSFELITSEVLDSYGYNVGSLSIGGPIIPGRASFFISGQGSLIADNSPYGGGDIFELSDEAYNGLLETPQVLQLECVDAAVCGEGFGDGDFEYIAFPFEAVQQGLDADGTFTENDLRVLVDDQIPDGFELVSGDPVNAPDTFTADQFDTVRGKDDPLEEITLNGNLSFNITPELSLRVGGGYETRNREEYSFTRGLYNRDRFYNDERDSWRVYGTFRQRLSDNAFYQIQGEYQDWKYVQYPNGFSGEVEDALFYGDLDNAYLETASKYYSLNESGYSPLYTSDGVASVGSVYGITFALPGAPIATYQQAHDQSLRFSGSATAQLGLHQIEFGAEFQQETRRFYSLAGFGLSRYFADDNVELGDGVANYGDLPFNAVRDRAFYYGYDPLGLNEVDDQDVDAYYDVVDDETGARANMNVAPYEPIYYAGYIQDKIEYRDLVINLGLRVDVFDNNSLRLFDVYAPRPILRASDVEGVPGSIGGDYAVYFNDDDDIVGYRDLEGNFFDAEGASSLQSTITEDRSGAARLDPDADRSDAFIDYEPEVTFMPRVGVSFPVTDRALFFASYNVTSQRPTERSFTPFRTYEEIGTQDSRVSNPALEPETTTQYELGFRQRLGERAALTLSGFYRTQENKISNRRLDGGSPTYGTYLNEDFTTTKGVEVEFDLRRTANLAINTNYTLSFAQGTGSDATATANIVWRGEFFPNFISAAEFDQRHTLNASVDYRLADDEGPMIGGVRPLENFGVNVLASFGSGTPYTPLLSPNPNSVDDSVTSDAVGTINSDYLPATYRLDLRVDRRFDLGFSGAQARIYLTVLNLLDTENVLAVYRATGLADQDGYLGTTGGLSALGNSVDPDSYAFNYSAYTSGPVNIGGNQSSSSGLFYGSPRQIRLGVLVNF